MSLRINHNIAAINGHRNLLRNDQAVSRSLEKLSSGLRINRAADDAAGLVISEQMRAQITGLNQAIDNTETGVAMLQTAEGALDEVNSLLNKARELVLHAANEGANDRSQLEADQAELDNVINSISRIAETTQFGTKRLLDGNLNGVSNISGGITRANIGNLANNSAVQPGTAQLTIPPISKQGVLLTGASATDDGTLFTPPPPSGFDLQSSTINSGVEMSLTIDGTSRSFIAGIGGATIDDAVAALDANFADYDLSFIATGAGFRVTHADFGNTTPVAATLSFHRGPTTAVVESVTAEMGSPDGSNAQTAGVIFSGATDLDAVNLASPVATGVEFSFVITDEDGNVTTGLVTASGADTLGSMITALQTELQTNAGTGANMANATIGFDAGAAANGFGLVVSRSGSDDTRDFSVAFNMDFPNAPGGAREIWQVTLTGAQNNTAGQATFADAGENPDGSDVLDAGITGASTVRADVGFSIQVNGQQYTTTSTSGDTVNAIVSRLTTMVQADHPDLTVAFAGDGTALTGITNDSTFTTTGASITGGSFVIYSSGPSTAVNDFDLRMDSLDASGLDVVVAGSEQQAGSTSAATLNLATLDTSRVDGITGVADTTISSNTSTTIAGVTNPAIDLDVPPGVTLNLQIASQNEDGEVLLGLANTTGNQGFAGIEIEIDGALLSGGGTATFDFDRGAVFQIGPNEDQTVGLNIRDLDAMELGRQVEGAGILTSLADLSSERDGALLNGLSTEALRVLDAAIDEVTVLRGELGAVQSNTFESTLSSLRVGLENLTMAESTIRDVDFAAESAEFTKNNILVQSATSMLAQANQLPQNVLQLLQ